MKFKDNYFTLDIDLSKPIEEIHQNINKKIRWSIRKAEKLGVTSNLANKEDFEEFCRIYEKYGYVKDIRKELGVVGDKGDIIEEDKDKGKLFVARHDNKLIGGTVIKFIGEDSIFCISFVIPEYKNFEVNSFLLWEAIKHSKNMNYKIFSLGGVAPDAREGTKFHHIYAFKLKWGGELRERYVYSKNPFYIFGRKLWRRVKDFKGR